MKPRFIFLVLLTSLLCTCIKLTGQQSISINLALDSLIAKTKAIKNPSFGEVNRAKIIVSQSYDIADRVNLPFKKLMSKCLQLANILEDTINYDLIIKIQVKGNPIGEYYVGEYNHNIKSFNYSGAYLKGTISFEAKNGFKYSNQFNGYIPTLREINKTYMPNDAPFESAFIQTLPTIIQTLYKPFDLLPILKALKDEDINFRLSAIKALGSIKDSRSVVPLIVNIQDKNSDVRVEAINALSCIKSKLALDPLIYELNDQNGNVRFASVKALDSLNDIKALDPLIALLKKRDDYVIFPVIKALGRLDDIRTVEPLLTALNDKYSSVRHEAILALRQKDDKHIVQSLIDLLNDQDIYVRNAAIESLGNLKDKKATVPLLAFILDQNYNINSIVIEALAKIKDDQCVQPLIYVMRYCGEDERSKIKKIIISMDPNWKNTPAARNLNDYDKDLKDYRKRHSAIDNLTDQNRLADLAINDNNVNIRRSALAKITDRQILGQIANKTKDPEIQSTAKNNIFRGILEGSTTDYAQITFFESSFDIIPKEQRVYKSEFTGLETRYVYWELNLHFNQPGTLLDFAIEAIWTDGDGKEITHQYNDASIQADWTHIWHCNGWGNKTPGAFWKPGIYFVELKILGVQMGKSSFKVN